MGGEVAVVQTAEWKQKAAEWYERGLDLQQQAREMRLDLAEHLLQGRDGEFYKAAGYTRFDDFAERFYGISKETARQYISIAENVLRALPEDVTTRLAFGDNPLPIKVLAALRFDHETLTPEALERIRQLDPEAQKEELLRLGYDREKMGGRAASDLLRKRISKGTYRDQMRRLALYREKQELLKAEKDELAGRIADMEAKYRALVDGISDPEQKKLLRAMEELTARIAELEKASALVEAERKKAKDAVAYAYEFVGELQARFNRFAELVRVGKREEWLVVWDALQAISQAALDCRGTLADELVARMHKGELNEFSVEEPRRELEASDGAMRPPERPVRERKG
jgi:hypothetical protein